MKCPKCHKPTKVIDKRDSSDHIIRRRRECKEGHRFTTYETIRTSNLKGD